jgi:hypothetical protein
MKTEKDKRFDPQTKIIKKGTQILSVGKTLSITKNLHSAYIIGCSVIMLSVVIQIVVYAMFCYSYCRL